METQIELLCSRCGKTYKVWKRFLMKRQTDLCKSCVLTLRNKTSKMREVSRRTGKISPSAATRSKLSSAQKTYWTDSKKQERTANGNPAWKGGKTHSRSGYVLLSAPGHPRATQKGQYVFEHILVMEKHIGRFLNEEEVVHHINGNPQDNKIENLLLTTKSEHMRIHNAMRKTHHENRTYVL